MVAVNEYLDPVIINIKDGSEVVEPEVFEERFKITVDEVKKVYSDNIEAIDLCRMMDTGVFSISYQDYLEMPSLLMELYSMYKTEKIKILEEKAK